MSSPSLNVIASTRRPLETLQVVRQAFTDTHGFVGLLLASTRGLAGGRYRVIDTAFEPGSRDDLKDLAERGLNEQGRVQCGGVIAAIVSRDEPQLIHDVEWANDPYFNEALARYTSVIAIPLVGERLPMNWAILLKKAPQRFTVSDVEQAVERAAFVGALFENQVLAGELAAANQLLDHEARQVGVLQRLLLPDPPPHSVALDVAASYEPATRASGDLYDFFSLAERDFRGPGNGADGSDEASERRWCVFIGDAAGHGLATAVVIAIVQAVLRAYPAGAIGPAALLAHANRQLCGTRLDRFVTAFLGIYEPKQKRLTYTNAGHPSPLLRRASDSSVTALDGATSYPLGVDETETFDEAAVQFERGDTVLLYTDGITEALNKVNAQFGRDRLTRVLRAAADPPAELIERLGQAVLAHAGGRAAEDDQTLVAARVL